MVPFILILAWSMGEITGAMEVGGFLTEVVQDYLVGGLVPDGIGERASEEFFEIDGTNARFMRENKL